VDQFSHIAWYRVPISKHVMTPGDEGHDFHESRHDVARNSCEISFSPHAADEMQTQGTGDLPLEERRDVKVMIDH
jgi:hypothetical protein